MTKIWDQKSAYLTPEDQELIRKQVNKLSNPEGQKFSGHFNVVDLGAGHGTTALTIFYASPCARVVSYDISQESIDLTRLNMIQYGFIDNWVGIRGRSDKPIYIPKPIDLLLCDATHDYASQIDEIRAWLPHLNEDTLIWVHDYNSSIYPGVRTAIDELVNSGILQEFEYKSQSWIGKIKCQKMVV